MSGEEEFESNFEEQRDEILALQSIFNTDDDEKMTVLSEATDPTTDLFTIMVQVCMRPVTENLTVHIVVPEEPEECQGAAAETHAPVLSNNIQLSRSISGVRWTGSFEVKYLSPLLLYISFPRAYPSSEPPSFHFECGWLQSQQIESLSSVMKQLWEDGSFMPVVYTWIDWLENNALNHLSIRDHITLQLPDLQQAKDESYDDQMHDRHEELGQVVAAIIQHNRQQMDIEFCQNNHQCEVCFEERPGTQFFRMHDCNHKFCHECMTAFCQFHVLEGTVEELRCLDTKCDKLLPPYILQAVLDPVAYDKWEKLLLQLSFWKDFSAYFDHPEHSVLLAAEGTHAFYSTCDKIFTLDDFFSTNFYSPKTLGSMSDTVYCPRCQSLVIREEEDLHLAHCTVCMFSFCTECDMVWHQGTSCQLDEEVLEKLTKKTNNLSPTEQRKLYKRIEEMKSKLQMAKSVKNCPKCKIKVEKNDGCNKMTCKCSQIFCWVCGKQIQGYSHFREGSCTLFPGQEPVPVRQPFHPLPGALLEMRARIAVNPDLGRNQRKCPGCKQMNLKSGSNNHLRCWNCKVNFCFLCNQRIMKNVTLHFRGPCQQHS